MTDWLFELYLLSEKDARFRKGHMENYTCLVQISYLWGPPSILRSRMSNAYRWESYLVAKIAGCWWFALCLVEIGEAPKLDLWFLPPRQVSSGRRANCLRPPSPGLAPGPIVMSLSMISNNGSATLLVTFCWRTHSFTKLSIAWVNFRNL